MATKRARAFKYEVGIIRENLRPAKLPGNKVVSFTSTASGADLQKEAYSNFRKSFPDFPIDETLFQVFVTIDGEKYRLTLSQLS